MKNSRYLPVNALRLLALLLTVTTVSLGGQAPQAGAAGQKIWQVFVPGASDIAADGTPGLLLEVRSGDLNQAAADGGFVDIPLPGGLTVRATVDSGHVRGSETFLAGALVDGPDGEVSLTMVGEALVGRIVMSDRLFLIRKMAGTSLHRISEADPQSFRPEGPALTPPLAPAETADGGVSSDPGVQGDTNQFVDMMIVYTPAARTQAGGTAAIVAELTGAVNNANLALANAGVTHRFRLVYQQEVSYTEVGASTDLNRLTATSDGFLDSVHTLRDAYRADEVVLLTADSSVCGVGWLMGPNSINSSFATLAFNVTVWDCANANLTLAHETGHNMGLMHDRANSGTSSPAFSYAYGYAIPGLARDVMAYPCPSTTPCARRTIFATPLYNFPGTSSPAGTATEDAARALNGTSLVVANFRQSLGVSRTRGDYEGDGLADPMVFRAGSGTWYQSRSSTGFASGTSFGFGVLGDVPLSGDYDGDGKNDLAVYRPSTGTWYIFQSSTSTVVSTQWGYTGDVPAPGDFDGDLKTDPAVYRPSNGTWYVLQSSTATLASRQWGLVSDIPVTADYDGDGKADYAVYRPSSGVWYALKSSTSNTTSSTVQWGGFNGDIPVPGDYDGDAKADAAVFRPSTGFWHLLKSSTNNATNTAVQWGGFSGDVPVPNDYDGDGKTDPAVFRRLTGTWHVLKSNVGYTTSLAIPWGFGTDIPVPNSAVANAIAMAAARAVRPSSLLRTSDVDGDAKADLTIYRPSTGTWFTQQSSTGFTTSTSPVAFGLTTDTPVAGDYDGDGKADRAVYRPSTGSWYILQSGNGAMVSQQFGLGGDLPVPGDYDGDGRTDIAVFRGSTGQWFILQSSTATAAGHSWGLNGDVPVPGDYDGDGKLDPAVYRPSIGTWFVLHSSTTHTTSAQYQFGLNGDVSVPADYDGDGQTDVAVWRPSTATWFLLRSSTGFSTFTAHQWGIGTDTVVPGDYDGDGKADLAVWRPSSGVWFVLTSGSNLTASLALSWGLPGDVPILKR